MRRIHWPLWWGWLLLPLPATSWAAAGCAATPGAAVLQAMGQDVAPGALQTGFRVRDIVVDPLLHRAFVHVEQCEHPERPLVLLPFAARDEARSMAVAAVAPVAPKDSEVPQPAKSTVPSGSAVAVAMGDAHVRLTVAGRLLEPASVGSVVDVQIASLSGSDSLGEPLKHVRGRLTAADRVEVEP